MIAIGEYTITCISDGTGVKTTNVTYALGSSATVPPGSPFTDEDGNVLVDKDGKVLTEGSWSETMPSLIDGMYLWSRLITIYDDGTFTILYSVGRSGEDGEKGDKGDTGDQGVSVTTVVPQYYISTSSSSLVGGSWSETKPSCPSGSYIWTRQKNILSDGTTTYSSAICDVTLSGLVFDVNKINGDITSKIWQSDITTSINTYDNSTAQSIRDRVSTNEQDIGSINSTISDIQTSVSTKADGSTVESLTTRISNAEQDVNGFKQTVAATYATKASTPEFIVGTQSSSTPNWTGVSHNIATLSDGQQITYWLPYSGGGNATLTLTLSTGANTDAIPCYYGETVRINNQYTAGSIIHFTYRENVTIGSNSILKGWWADANYFENTYDRVKYSGEIYAKTTLTRFAIVVSDEIGYMNLNSGSTFNVNYPILYMFDNGLTAETRGSGGYTVIPATITETQSEDLTTSQNIYIKGTLNGLEFTPISTTPLTQTVPASEDGYYYMFLGTAFGTAPISRTFYLLEEHPIYIFRNGLGFVRVETAALTVADQTAAGFRWIVSSGTSATDFQLTDRTAELVSQYINLHGKVTFNGLNSATQNKIDQAAADASSAVSTANTASTTATTAQTTANTAKTTADTAQSTANTANTNASNALSTANTTHTELSNYKNENSVIIGTQTAATGTFLGDANFSTLTDGRQITYWLPFAYSSTNAVSYTPTGGSAATGAALKLTLFDNTETEAIPCFYNGITRLTTHYGAGNIIRFVYRENVTIGSATVLKGWWADANYNTNDNTYDRLRYYQNITADTSGVTASNIIVGLDGKYHNLKTGGNFDITYPILYCATTLASNTVGKNNYLCIPFTSTTTQNTSWTTGKPVYIKGTLSGSIFTPVSTTPLTQTVPTSVDNYYYILLGSAYSSTAIYLAYDHSIYQYYDGAFKSVSQIATEAAVKAAAAQTTANNAMSWINTTGSTAKDILVSWTNDATLATTTIDGGYIKTHTIESQHLATNAIMSSNFIASDVSNSPYSASGSFLDLTNGNFYTQNFGVNNTIGKAFINGEIVADSGSIGSDSINYWGIGTFTDYNGDDSAALIGHGSSFIQSGWWQISDDRINTQKYANNNSLTYLLNNDKYFDYGMKVPSFSSTANGDDAWLYIRRSASNSIPTIAADWTYLFKVDKDGNVYENGVKLSEKYASISGVGSAYLPTTGGTISGNLTVTGTLTATASQAIKLASAVTIRTDLSSTSTASFDGSTSITPGVTGTLGASNGGTGQTSLVNAAKALINALSVGSNPPVDDDYFISQYVGGGTSNTNYYRRPISTIWTYIKDKIDNIYEIENYRLLDDNSFDTADVTELSVGNVIVSGAARFTNGLYGNLVGNVIGTASNAAQLSNSLKIQLNSGTIEGTNQYTFSGLESMTINITKDSIGLNNVENTADANKNVATATTLATSRNIDGISFNGGSNIARYGTCSTAAATAAKVVSVNGGSGFSLETGAFVIVKFTYTNSVANPTLNVNNTGGVPIKRYGTTAASTSANTSWYAGTAVGFIYDGSNWLMLDFAHRANDNTIPQGYCSTAAGTAAKVVSCTSYVLTSNSYLMVLITNANTASSALTLNVNNKGAKRIYINGSASSESNHTLPAGSYLTYYDGTNYHFRTDGKITGDITGHAFSATNDAEGNQINSTYLKLDGGTVTGSLILSNTTNASAASSNDVALIIGEKTGGHLEFDGNEIIAKASGTTGATLNLNLGSGNIYLGEHVYTTNSGTVNAVSFVGALTGNATSADQLSTSRSLTIGGTSKNVDWSDAVSFSKSEISGAATSSSFGWMSAADKSKLDSITVSAIGTVNASSIVGTDGITATVDNGVATIGHSNSTISPGTTSGTSNSGNVAFGATITMPQITYDEFGHITSVDTCSFKLPTAPTTITGNAGTATKFSSARTITLTGDTIGSASSDGESGWSIATTTDIINSTRLTNEDLNDIRTAKKARFYYAGGGNTVANNPSEMQFGLITYGAAIGYVAQELISRGNSNSSKNGKWFRIFSSDGSNWSSWQRFVTSLNYTDYTVQKDGTGATGIWEIDISGTASNATNDADGNEIASTYLKLSGGEVTDNITFSATNKGLYLTDSTGTTYPAIMDNGTHLWIGASLASSSIHHTGKTFISSGLNSSNNTGNDSIYVAIPSTSLGNNAYSSNYYKVLHAGNYTSYAVPKGGGTMTGDLTIQKSSAISSNAAATILFKTVQTDNNVTSTASIKVYDDHDALANGTNMVVQSAGNMIIGGGESPSAYYSAHLMNNTSEQMYITSDSNINFVVNGNTIANHKKATLNSELNFYPSVTETGALGTSSYKWHDVYSVYFHGTLDGTASRATNDSDGNAISSTYAKLSGATFTGEVSGTTFKASNYISVNSGNSATAGGLVLYGTSVTNYGIAMRNTTNSGCHGYVQGDWGIYSYMNGTDSTIAGRGWVLKDAYNSSNVASVNTEGNAVFNGSITVGGNATNTSGCELVYSNETNSLKFVFK